MSLVSSPPRTNKFGPGTVIKSPAILSPLTVNRASSTPRISLLPRDEAPPRSEVSLESPVVIPGTPGPIIAPALVPSSSMQKKVQEFLERPPTYISAEYAMWLNPRIYETVEVTNDKEFPITVRFKQKLSPQTVDKLKELFKSSWYEPKGIHGVQTDSVEKALERLVVAHFLEEGKRSYEEIKQLKLGKQIKENRSKFETLIHDSTI